MKPTLFTFLYGPTASGKTAFAWQWAKTTGGNLLSVDSRQIYTDMSVVVGKDLPPNSVWRQHSPTHTSAWHLTAGNILWGLDLVPPDEIFTISHWYRWSQPLLQWHRDTQTPLLLVGGTWPWMEVLLKPPPSLFVPPDTAWRAEAAALSLSQLQTQLQGLAPDVWQAMKPSDQNNPRRLIRAIEVQRTPEAERPVPLLSLDEVQILLRDASLDDLTASITQRVLQRWEAGAREETKLLLEKFPDWTTPAFSATGYRWVREVIEGTTSQADATAAWIQQERDYAKRQKTWVRFVQRHYEHTLV